jgi:hypothetical protein
MKRSPRRSAFIGAGVWVAFANLLVVLCYSILYPEYSRRKIAFIVLVCGLRRHLVGPSQCLDSPRLLKAIGGYVTDIKLLELASLDRRAAAGAFG